jgi:hypothetical protein
MSDPSPLAERSFPRYIGRAAGHRERTLCLAGLLTNRTTPDPEPTLSQTRGESLAAGHAPTDVAVVRPSPEAVSADGMFRRAHDWIVEHDESKLFLVLYVGLAVVLSIWISLFWLVAVVAVHFGFELIRQARHQETARAMVLEALWEVKLDIALVLFALALALYMELVLGVVGLQGAARIGAASRAATRFAGWERAIRGVLLSLDDAAQVIRATVMKRARAADAPTTYGDAPAPAPAGPTAGWGSWGGGYGAGAWISLGLGVACLVLLFAAPWLTPHTAETALATLAAELRPLP